MKKLVLLIPVILFTATLAGCSVGPLPGSAAPVSAASAAPSQTVAPAADSTTEAQPSSTPVNVCKAVSVGLVNLLTSRHYKTAIPMHSPELDGCNYYGANPKSLRFSLGVYNGGATMYKQLVKDYTHFKIQPIPHLDDQAEYLVDSVIIRKGDSVYLALDGIAPVGTPYLTKDVLVEIIEALQPTR
jgi:hypothetical protein